MPRRGILLVSANVGGVDPVFPLPVGSDVDSLYFTDKSDHVPGWQTTVRIQPKADPRLAAKWYKCQINRIVEARGYNWLAWADGNIKIKSTAFLTVMANKLGTDYRAGVIPHPFRNTVAEEYEYVLKHIRAGNPYLSKRYPESDIVRERAYFSERHDLTRLRLWVGSLWLFPSGSKSDKFFDSWWSTVLRYSSFDQAAMSPLLVEAGIEPVAHNVNLYHNDEFDVVYHE